MSAFCPRCGGGSADGMCGTCGYRTFVNPRPTGGVIVLDGYRYLALLRAHEPNSGRWDLPSGFCDGWEHPADAAVREAREELGVTVTLDRFVGMYLGEYRYQEERLPVLDCFWLASIVDGELRPDPAEASDHAWLPLADHPAMAFATQDEALREVARFIDWSPGYSSANR